MQKITSHIGSEKTDENISCPRKAFSITIRIISTLPVFFVLFIFQLNAQNLNSDYDYLSPLPNSKTALVQTEIIIRSHYEVDSSTNKPESLFVISGSKSGIVSGKTILSDDNRTFLFLPEHNFASGETVKVKFIGGIHTKNNQILKSISFSFIVSSNQIINILKHVDKFETQKSLNKLNNSTSASPVKIMNGVSIPVDYPEVKVEVNTNPSPGFIYLNNWGGIPYLMILNNDGSPVFYRRMPYYARDFKHHKNGLLTYRMSDGVNSFFAMDSTYTVIDTFQCGHGYGTDEHELQFLPNGHVLMIGLDYRSVDMSKIVSGGNPNATVIGNTVIELDKNNNIVFEWKSWDHYKITDAEHINLTNATLDYVHMNAISVDDDGNLVVSARHLSEITKIDHKTGDIIWRLGGKNNQFTYVNDPYKNSYQHDIRALGNNHYTIFDNGNYHNPPFSRAVEYKIDTSQKTATLVWQYRNNPDYYSWWMGDVQRLPNGNTLIGWADASVPKVTEVTPSGEKVYQLDFVNPANCYRAFKFNWQGKAKIPYLIVEPYNDRIRLLFNKFGDMDVVKYYVYAGHTSSSLKLIDSVNTPYDDLLNLENNTNYYFRVKSIDMFGHVSEYSNEENLFVRYINPGENFILNGDFEEGDKYWTLYNTENGVSQSVVTNNGEYFIAIGNGGNQGYSVQLQQKNLPMNYGEKYILQFDAYAFDNRTITPIIQLSEYPWTNYSKTGAVLLTKTIKHYSFEFEMAEPSVTNAQLVFNCGLSDINVVLDNISLKTVSGVNEAKEAIPFPQKFQLLGNYPNPFNPETKIQYYIPSASNITISVYNLLGELIKKYFSDYTSPGFYNTQINLNSCASGVYIYKIEILSNSGSKIYSSAKKFVLMK